MAKNLASSVASGVSQQELDLILNGDYQDVFYKQKYFSLDSSMGHIFDVVHGTGTMRCDVRGDKLAEIVKVSDDYFSLLRRFLGTPPRSLETGHPISPNAYFWLTRQ